jgi:hypothetical protein
MINFYGVIVAGQKYDRYSASQYNNSEEENNGPLSIHRYVLLLKLLLKSVISKGGYELNL